MIPHPHIERTRKRKSRLVLPNERGASVGGVLLWVLLFGLLVLILLEV